MTIDYLLTELERATRDQMGEAESSINKKPAALRQLRAWVVSVSTKYKIRTYDPIRVKDVLYH